MSKSKKATVAIAKSNSIMNSVSAQIIRCGCTNKQKSDPNWHGNKLPNRNAYPCPNPSKVEDRGIIAFWHKNPIKRFIFWLRSKFPKTINKV